MFGYIRANLDDLTDEEKQRYQAVYCGVCRSLGERHGQLARMGLTYDLTFLALLLTSLYEPEESGGCSRCMVHPCKKHPFAKNKYTDYAADMTVALMYFKSLDDWEDDKNLPKKCYASILKKPYQTVKKAWPQQCETMETELAKIHEIEQGNLDDPDAAANAFGRLMAEAFVMENDLWESHLRAMGYNLGRYIYFADAAVDYADDVKKDSYNPLNHISMSPQEMRSPLKIMLGEASQAFEMLPLVQDTGLLRNILYSGIWLKYNAGMEERKKQNDGE